MTLGRPSTVAGVDGCRTGWVVATVSSTGAARLDVRVVAALRPVAADVAAGRLAAAAVDIPIGLAPRGDRACDREARRLLGPRRSSVFPAPARCVLGAATYKEACTRSVEACGKKLSVQLYNILPKIGEVDALESPALQGHLFEMCPELSFAVLAGAPMRANKRTPAGRSERLAALEPVFGDLSETVARPPSGATPDDVLDAIVGAWSARRFVAGVHVRLGGEVDATGLRMEMVA